jgi:phosphopantothenoylcysteine decarboxylase/phosphopantothenate--cysteine ligase
MAMTKLNGKRVLLGITGGIAAYKAAELVRLLRGAEAEVQVVMTPAAANFITPMTLQALSGRPVRLELFDPEHEAAMGHIELARWPDLILVAPASADFMARLTAGMADDLLSTLCLASDAPIALAPAMNRLMWENGATCDNVRRLEQRGIRLWGPATGDQACGETGPGRMLEPQELLQRAEHSFSEGPLRGVRVLLTAGPTREPIDPVRFVGNRSSGKMGYALASAFTSAGAEVSLVSGPVALDTPAGVARIDVETAQEMEQAVLSGIAACDIFVACAAVADYRPLEVSEQKIKKSKEQLQINLTRNPDILAKVAAGPGAPFTVGFAAETERPAEQGEAKRRSKGADMIAANLVGGEQGGFEREENALAVIWEGGRQDLPMAPKGRLAEALVSIITEKYYEKNRTKDS